MDSPLARFERIDFITRTLATSDVDQMESIRQADIRRQPKNFFNAKDAKQTQRSLKKNLLRNLFADLASSWRSLRLNSG